MLQEVDSDGSGLSNVSLAALLVCGCVVKSGIHNSFITTTVCEQHPRSQCNHQHANSFCDKLEDSNWQPTVSSSMPLSVNCHQARCLISCSDFTTFTLWLESANVHLSDKENPDLGVGQYGLLDLSDCAHFSQPVGCYLQVAPLLSPSVPPSDLPRVTGDWSV